MEINIENGNNINVCQKFLELENEEAVAESISKELKIGEAVEVDKCKGRALEEARDMGLAVEEDPIEDPKEGGNKIGSVLEMGCRKTGTSFLDKKSSPADNINYSQENEFEKDDYWNPNLESEEERKKRDRALHKERGKEVCKYNERIVNLSLSDSDLSNRMKVILRETKNTWAIGKKLGLIARSDEADVIEDIMRAECQ
ncbi:hypothetical protein J1N35_001860 [Gossypium stocksii]|uniref:Uncharacterized protein n=1 Tax=Gossypium stocksii TaxID=47602 RepID=A0A9D3WIJ6_9ROSI|nr:hypothetical protein J1N35_001860 [Gossypium stocksii]